MSSHKSISSALASITKKLQKDIDSVLETDVAEGIRDDEIMAIGNTVYSVYGNTRTKEPNRYVRRYDEGGLADRANMPASVSNGTLSVKNTTPANSDYGNSGYLAGDIVLNGGPYDYKPGVDTFGDFRHPRDFIEETYDNLKRWKTHVNALKNGLSSKGYDIQ